MLLLLFCLVWRFLVSSDYVKSVFFDGEVVGGVVGRVVDGLTETYVSPDKSVGGVVDKDVGLRDKSVLVRVSVVERDRWQAAAEADGLSMSEWVRGLAEGRWRELFVCEHPVGLRRVFPWSEVCLGCGARLR